MDLNISVQKGFAFNSRTHSYMRSFSQYLPVYVLRLWGITWRHLEGFNYMFSIFIYLKKLLCEIKGSANL
jgi:hypothetical protein